MKKIMIIRHAQSIANAGGKTNDPGKISLSTLGFVQAKELASKITLAPDIFVLSKYIRTHQTASPLLGKFPEVPVEVWDMIHEFTYLNQANCINMNSLERSVLTKEYWLNNDPYYNDGGNAESFLDFVNRVENFIDQVKIRSEYNIFIFSHGQFILALEMRLQLEVMSSNLTEFMREFKKRSLLGIARNASMTDISLICK